jgi:integrase
MAGGGKRRNVQTISIPSKEHLLNIIKAHTNLSLAHKAFICFLYLTGARVGEICANRPVLKKDLVIVKKTGWAVYREYTSGHDWRGITIGQLSFKEIEFKSTGQKKFVCLIENVPTEKRRG